MSCSASKSVDTMPSGLFAEVLLKWNCPTL